MDVTDNASKNRENRKNSLEKVAETCNSDENVRTQ